MQNNPNNPFINNFFQSFIQGQNNNNSNTNSQSSSNSSSINQQQTNNNPFSNVMQGFVQQNIQNQSNLSNNNTQSLNPAVNNNQQNNSNIPQHINPLASVIQGFTQQAIRSTFDNIQQGLPLFHDEIIEYNVNFTYEQLQFFKTNGYIQLSNIVDDKLIKRALCAINQQLGKGMTEVQAAQGNVIRGGLGYYPELSHTSIILDLVKKSPVYSYIKKLIGDVHPIHGAQIALRFPGKGCITKEQLPQQYQNMIKMAESCGINVVDNQMRKPDGYLELHPFIEYNDYLIPRKWKEFWHIDGVHNSKSPINLVPQGQVLQFTLLVGVLLKDLPQNFSGNLAVFPGSHITIQNFVNQNGVDPKSLLEISSNDNNTPNERVKLPNPPIQIKGKAGDVILCHWQLAHTVVANASPDIRYCVYFRFHSKQRKPGIFKPEAMKNCWLEFEGIQSIC